MRSIHDERLAAHAPQLNTLVATAVAGYQAELNPTGEDQIGLPASP